MSSDEELDFGPEPPRVRRHRFKTFAERIAEVDVDVFRRLAPVRDVPQNGASTFLVEALNKWRELNSTEHFTAVASAVSPLCESLPQLVHHADQILDHLLSVTHMGAALALPGVLALVAALARDLQAEFVTTNGRLARVLKALAVLLDVQGGYHNPDVIEQVFTCVSLLFKHLARHLVSDLPSVLRHTQGLRYARAPYVRAFAAQAVGFLIRAVAAGPAADAGAVDGSSSALRSVVRALLAEHAVRPTEERTDGAGRLLAESVLGIGNGLHSRAPAIFALTFTENLLRPSDFKGGRQQLGTEVLRARAASVASVALDRVLSHLRRGKGGELWSALLGEAARRLAALESALKEAADAAKAAAAAAGQEGSAAEGSGPQQRPAKRARLSAAAAGRMLATGSTPGGPPSSTSGSDAESVLAAARAQVASAAASAARGVAHVAQAVHYFRGSRVESYDQIQELVACLMQDTTWTASAVAAALPPESYASAVAADGAMAVDGEELGASEGDEDAVGEAGGGEGQGIPWWVAAGSAGALSQGSSSRGDDDAQEPFLRPSLSQQVLRLVLGVVLGHTKVVGASQGVAALVRHLPTWGPCFSRPPTHELLPFVAGLAAEPATPEVTRLFGPRMLGALAPLVVSLPGAEPPVQQQGHTPPAVAAGGKAGATQQAAQQQGRALGLLVQVCSVLEPLGAGAAAAAASGQQRVLPLLLTAQPGGVKLAAAVRQLLSTWCAAVTLAAGDSGATAGSNAAATPAAVQGSAAAGGVQAGSKTQRTHRRAAGKGHPATPPPSTQQEQQQGGSQTPGLVHSHSSHQLASSPHLQQGALAVAWAALQLMPHACESPAQALALCERAQAAAALATGALSQQQQQQSTAEHPQGGPSTSSTGASPAQAPLQGLLCVHGVACELVAQLLPAVEAGTQTGGMTAQGAQRLVAAAQQSLDWLRAHPDSKWAAHGAAALLGAVRQHASHLAAAQKLLSASTLEAVLPSLLPHLAAPSQGLRAAVLNVLCCFDQPPLLPPGSSGAEAAAAETAGSKAPKVEVLPLLRAIASEPCTLEAGRRWAVALIRQGGHAEYGRIPPYMMPALIVGLLGVLRVRFSPLWPAATQALAACLEHQPKVVWPIIKDALASTQDELLHGWTPPTRTTSPGGGKHKGKGGRGKGGKGGKAARHQSSSSQSGEGERKDYDGQPGEAADEEEEDGLLIDVEGLADGERRLARVSALDARFSAAVSGQGSLSSLSADSSDGEGIDPEERGSTEPHNRLSHLLKSLAKAPHAVLEPVARDWVPLFLEYARAGKAGQLQQQQGQEQTLAAAGKGDTGASTGSGGQGEDEEGDELGGGGVMSRIGARTYRSLLQDWLSFLSGIKGLRGLPRSNEVQVAVALAVDADEPGLQAAALKTLAAFKHKYLVQGEHLEQLLRLVDDKTLREQLPTLPLPSDSTLSGSIAAQHRPGLIPLLIRVLYPKIRKRSNRLAGRGAVGSARSSILNFLAGADPLELRPLVEAFLEPLGQVFICPPGPSPGSRATVAGSVGPGLVPQSELQVLDAQRILPVPWWMSHLGCEPIRWWLAAVDPARLAALPARLKVSFLHAFEDMVDHLGHRLQPMLPCLLALTLSLLEEAVAPVAAQQQAKASDQVQDAGAGAEAAVAPLAAHEDKSREVRSTGLRLLANLWLRFPTAAEYNDVWPVLLPAVEPLMARLPTEASADKEPPLLACAFALSASTYLLPVLGNLPSTLPSQLPTPAAQASSSAASAAKGTEPQGTDAITAALTANAAAALPSPIVLDTAAPPAPWAVQGLGGKLLRSVIAMLNLPSISPASRSGVLDVVENILEAAAQQETLANAVAAVAAVTGSTPAAGTAPQPAPAPAMLVIAAAAQAAGVAPGTGARLVSTVLGPWLDELLVALKGVVLSAWGASAAGPARSDPAAAQRTGHSAMASALVAAGAGRKGRGGAAQGHAHRELGILERLGGQVSSPLTGLLLGDALAGLVSVASSGMGRRGTRAKLDEAGLARALGALSALWGKVAQSGGLAAHSAQGGLTEEALWRYWETLSQLALRLDRREARMALGTALSAAARLLPDAPTAVKAADLLSDLTSWSTVTLDEPDYDRRMRGYGALTVEAWQELGRLQALPLLLACLHDLRNPDDLTLRQAAATSLERFITAAVAVAASAGGPTAAVDSNMTGSDASNSQLLSHLVTRVLYPQLKSQLSVPSLAVRQEHLALLRALVIAFPSHFPDLHPLVSLSDPETDFFLNAAHLQLHRRSRALARLAKLADSFAAAAAAASPQGGGSAPAQPAQQASPAVQPHKAGKRKRRDSQSQEAQQEEVQPVQQQAPPTSLRALLDVAVPLIQVMVTGAPDESASRLAHERDSGDVDREASVVDSAITALRAVAGALPWAQYDQLLSQFMRGLKASTSKPSVRSVCVILDAFHFQLPHTLDPALLEKHSALIKGAAAGNAAAAAVAKAATNPAPAAKEPAGAGDGHQPPDQHEDKEEEEDEADADGGDIAMAEEEDGKGPEAREKQAVLQAVAVELALRRRVLPVLHSLLVLKGDAPVVRAPVALALVKLLKLLPKEYERRELPRALGGICNLLADRAPRVREDARAVLVAVARELGPQYMPYIINVLRATLPDKGFTAHVIGYTLHAVLEAVVGHLLTKKGAKQAAAEAAAANGKEEEGAGGAGEEDEEEEWAAGDAAGAGQADGPLGLLDDSLELALPLIENEIFGEVAEAKEVAVFANNYKEAKRVRGYESYQLLAAAITFGTHMDTLLSLVRDRLPSASSPNVRNKISSLLQYAARGVHANPTARPVPLAIWVHGALRGGISREEAARKRAKSAAEGAAGKDTSSREANKVAAVGSVLQGTVAGVGKAKRTQQLSEEDRAALHEYLVVDFALQLLYSSMRRGALSGRAPETLGLLDPLLPLLSRALRCRHAGSVTLALRCLSYMVTLPLPGMAASSMSAGKGVTQLLQRVPDSSHPLALESFRLLAGLLRECAAYQPTTPQVQFLLKWLFSDRKADDSTDRGAAFALLRAILARRLVVPEVYDVMAWVQALMVKSQSTHVRQVCASALLQYLLDYPLGPKRLQQHLSFLATNLSYEHELGRLQVLDMLNQIIIKFPAKTVVSHSELFLLPLVTRLVNDTSPKCRANVASVLKALLGALPTNELDTFAGFCQTWLSGDNPQLRRAAAQALGLQAEAEGSKFGRRLSDPALTGPLLACLHRQAANSALASHSASVPGMQQPGLELGESEGGGEQGSTCPGWHEAYFCLGLLEKVITAAPATLALPAEGVAQQAPAGWCPQAPQFWEAVLGLMLHRHAWVRKAAARLVGAALASPHVAGGLFVKPSRAGELAFSLFLQLDCQGADEATCRQAVKCLVAIAARLAAEPQPVIASHGNAVVANGHANGVDSAANGAAGHSEDGAGAEEEGMDGSDEQEGEEMDEEGQAGDMDEGEDGADDEQQQDDADGHALQGQDTEEGEGGDGDDEDGGDDGGRDVPMSEQYEAHAFTLRGLVRRMARLADNARMAWSTQRMAALSWIAAVATKLGGDSLAPFLDILVLPLYRLSETTPGAAQPPPHVSEAKSLGEEVLAHLRSIVGPERLLSAYNAARERVRHARTTRRQRAATRAMLDPEGAAAARIKRNQKKAAGRKRKLEAHKRARSAHTFSRAAKRFKSGGGGGSGAMSSGGGGGRGGTRGGRGRGSGVTMYTKSRNMGGGGGRGRGGRR